MDTKPVAVFQSIDQAYRGSIEEKRSREKSEGLTFLN